MANLSEILKNALSLEVRDRATLAERLLASLEEITEEEAEQLWAEEAERRLKEYRANRAQAVQAEEVQQESGTTVPVIPLRYHEAAEPARRDYSAATRATMSYNRDG
jgi:putative addiction module component (TIGR02574 family)